ncbi:type II toxin-antitoxin system toxin DNA ADP-ribosyl transferase DarT [Stenotrophomonas maltophilia]|uniref:type II toxin-antitoxin system toxin DNA ADP-ribosyl transferase DarT n=1 Tax=Stenotrophomonas maltophilia TaxID=40324 RepID=UPI0022AC29E0|nr:DUF4433 domain-containing protein [Stenotrophomonas maltophilia]
MAARPAYHITDVSNLPSILSTGGLLSDARMQGAAVTVIGYSHIKERRLTVAQVDCFADRPFVGEFVPFYYCYRSVMLYTVNNGNVGRPAGCQNTIVHLVTNTDTLIAIGRQWAISDGNASASHTSFFSDVAALDQLNWNAINATYWSGQQHQKCAEFLVKDFVPWSAISHIGCYDANVAAQVEATLDSVSASHRPQVIVKREWYY